MTTEDNSIFGDTFPPGMPAPFSRDVEIGRLQWQVGILTKRLNELTDRLMEIERQQVAATPTGQRRNGG
jgi:hypothetical protein